MKITVRKVSISKEWAIVILVFLLASSVVMCNVFVFLSILIFLLACSMCMSNIYEHVFLLLFFVAFFTFLLGGQVVYEFFGYPMAYDYQGNEYNDMNFKVLLSILSIATGYLFGKKQNRETPAIVLNTSTVKRIRKISVISFFLLLIPYCLTLIEAIAVVRVSGYMEYYSYESRLPSIINELADLYMVSFCLFLATFPTKKEAHVPIRVFFLLSILTLLVGRRIYFVSQSMLLLGYIIIRNKEEIWIRKRTLVIIVCTMPLLVVGLYAIRYIRYGREIQERSFFPAFLSFFQQQGFSANLIMLEKRFESSLSNDWYSLYNIRRFLRINPVSRYVLRLNYMDLYTGSRENLALHSGSFARMISYLAVRAKYLQGYGMGSCYIAELYHDLGYFGIAIGNMIYGFLLRRINNFGNSVIKNTIYLMTFRHLLMVPRYNYDLPFFVVFSISFWLYIASVYAFVNITKRREHLA